MNLMEILERAAKPMQPNTQETTMPVNLADRSRTHGNYKDTAALSQSIKDVLRSGRNWSSLTDSQRESLESISVKLARILNGNANFRDHWDDIVGYGQLAADSVTPTMPQISADIAQTLNETN